MDRHLKNPPDKSARQALFSQATMDFLIENRIRNDKSWFDLHRDEYRALVIDPFVAIVEELTPTLLEIDPALVCSPKVGGSISRIWRDARFSRDKSLFRDSMWCKFTRDKSLGYPEFFFAVYPGGYIYGCGYYAAGAAKMESIRELIKSRDPAFTAALCAYEGQSLFRIDGERYKKSRSPDEPDNIREWLDRKTISLVRDRDDLEFLYGDSLAGDVAAGFRLIAPIYNFFLKAEGRLRAERAAGTGMTRTEV